MARVGPSPRPRRGAAALWILIGAISLFMIIALPANKKRSELQVAKVQQVTKTPKAAVGDQKPDATKEPETAAEGPADGTHQAAEGGDPAATNPQPADGSSDAAKPEGEQQQQPAEAGKQAGSQHGTGIFFEVPAPKEGDPPTKMELLNEPVPEDCFMEEHADYDGPSLTWGLTYKLASAAQCCQACKDRKVPQDDGLRCNVWVYCPSPTGECWSPDIWNHTTGECWLKFQGDWDGNTDRAASNLVVNHRGKYPAEFRSVHREAPEMVAWAAGVIPP